jgi:plastocyanin
VNRTVTVVATSLLTAIGGVTFAAVESAAATSCAATITISGPTNGKLVLTPRSVSVAVGDCVGFTNAAASQVTVNVANGAYAATLGKGATATGKAGFKPKATGKDAVTATGKALLLLKAPTGSASISVTPAPSHTPTPSGSPKPNGGGHSSGKPRKHPSVAPHPHKSKRHTPRPKATGIKLPKLPPLPTTGITALPRASNPLVAPGPASAPAVTDSSSPVAAVIGGPLEPTGDNRRGLPVAVGVLVVLGMVTGWGRVLLAQPSAVDNRAKGDHRL